MKIRDGEADKSLLSLVWVLVANVAAKFADFIGALISSALRSPSELAAQSQPAWFVDPSNVSGKASNQNDGLTALTPLLTFNEITRRWGTSTPTLAQDTTINMMSDQPDFTDPVNVRPILLQSSLFIKGTLISVISDTIGVFTPRNMAEGIGTVDSLTGTAITDFAPYDQLMIQTATGTFWIFSETGASANVTAPMATGLSATPPAFVTPADGEAFTIFRPSKIFIESAAMSISSTLNSNFNNAVVLQNLWATSYNDPFLLGLTNLLTEKTIIEQCRIDTEIESEGVFSAPINNSNLVGGINASGNFLYGGAVGGPTANPIAINGQAGALGLGLDGNVICTNIVVVPVGATLTIGFASLRAPFFLSFGILDVLGGQAWLTGNAGSTAYGPGAAIWGTAFIFLTSGGAFRIVNTTHLSAMNGVLNSFAGFVFTIEGAVGGPGTTQFATYTAGAWTHYTPGFTPASLPAFDALAAANEPNTAAIQNPDTGSAFILNGDNNPAF
jgi:hypothetical protein